MENQKVVSIHLTRDKYEKLKFLRERWNLTFNSTVEEIIKRGLKIVEEKNISKKTKKRTAYISQQAYEDLQKLRDALNVSFLSEALKMAIDLVYAFEKENEKNEYLNSLEARIVETLNSGKPVRLLIDDTEILLKDVEDFQKIKPFLKKVDNVHIQIEGGETL